MRNENDAIQWGGNRTMKNLYTLPRAYFQVVLKSIFRLLTLRVDQELEHMLVTYTDNTFLFLNSYDDVIL